MGGCERAWVGAGEGTCACKQLSVPVCACTGNMSTHVHNHMCACELVCTAITVRVSPRGCANKLACVSSCMSINTTQIVSMCVPVTPSLCVPVCEHVCLHVSYCVCAGMSGTGRTCVGAGGPCRKGAAEMQGLCAGRCGDPFCRLSRSLSIRNTGAHLKPWSAHQGSSVQAGPVKLWVTPALPQSHPRLRPVILGDSESLCEMSESEL